MQEKMTLIAFSTLLHQSHSGSFVQVAGIKGFARKYQGLSFLFPKKAT